MNYKTTDLMTRLPYSRKGKRCANNVKHSAKLLGSVVRGPWTVKQDLKCDCGISLRRHSPGRVWPRL